MKKKLFKIIMLFAVLASLLTLVSCLKSDEADFTKIKVVMLESDGVKVLSKQIVEIKPGNDVTFNIKLADEYAYLGMTKNGNTVREEEGVPAKEFPIEGEFDEKNGIIKLKAIKYPATIEVIAKPKADLYSFELKYNDRQGGAHIVGGTKLVKDYKWLPQTDGKLQLSAYPNGDYSFSGWTVGDYIENGGRVVSYDKDFEFEITENTVMYANFSDIGENQYRIVYHMNGGKVAIGENAGKTDYTVLAERSAQYAMQQTMISNGTFERDGYVAVGYATKAVSYESYESVNSIPGFSNMGGVCRVPQSGQLSLHVVWAKETAASDFTFSGGVITKYNGSAQIVVIPEKINGTPVKEIAAGAFKDKTGISRLVIPRTVTKINDGAFENCTGLKEVVFFDSLSFVTDEAFKGCTKLSTVTLNAQRLPKYSGEFEGSFCIKYERLRTVTGKKLVVLAGSSAVHSIVTPLLEENFPGYSVVNYGNNSTVPALFYLDVIENYIGKDDIVIHAPEIIASSCLGDNTMNARVFRGNEQCYDIFRDVDISKYKGFWTSWGKFQNGDPSDPNLAAANTLVGREYQLPCSQFNEYGDSSLSKKSPLKDSFGKAECVFNTNLLNYESLNDANDAITAKGAILLMSFAPRDVSRLDVMTAIKSEYDRFTRYCERNLDYPVISNIGNYVIEHAYFYDSEHNVNDDGAKKIISTLTYDINRYLADKNSGAPMLSSQLSILYNANGGTVNGVGQVIEESFDISPLFSMQQTIWSNGTFIRDGYTAVGYSTKSGASFEAYESVNSIPGFSNMGGVCEVPSDTRTLFLYVVWAKNTASTYFEFNNGIITKYTGSADIVVIPEYIDGEKVERVAAGAFKNKTTLKRLVLPKTIITLDDGAFEGCTNLREVVFFDSILYVTNNAFGGCNKLSTITLNSQRLPKYSGDAAGTFGIKYQRIRTLRNQKKIIVVSGSSTLYGLDSATMEASFPGYNVVNYGTNVSHCSLFVMDAISKYLGEDDIVIHAPEMSGTVMGDNQITPKLFRGHNQVYDIFREVDMTEYRDFWSAWGKYQMGDPNDSSLTPANNISGKPYQKDTTTLDKYGDLTQIRPAPRVESFGTANQGFNKGILSSANAARLNALNKKIKANGATLLMSFAPRDISRMNPAYTNATYYNDYTTDCANKLDYAVISNVGTYLFEHKYMFDSEYHVNDTGSALRTQLLTEDLKRYLANPNGFTTPML